MSAPAPLATTASAPLAVHELTGGDRARWDDFVDRCPEATFFHRAGWQQVLTEGLGHAAPFLYAARDGAIEGVLPLAHVRSLLFGRALVSTPFCAYGGVAATSDPARQALEAEACRRAEALGVDYLELRHREPVHTDWPARRERYVTFRQALDPDPAVNLQRIRRKQRAMIRKGIAAGLVARVDDDIDGFYRVFAESVRNLGTPVLHRRYFHALRSAFGADCELLGVWSGRQRVAGVLSFYFRDEVLPYHGGGGEGARGLCAHDFMYWTLMHRACEAGVRTFDYGRSKIGSGSYDFKRHWDFPAAPLHYEYHLVRARALPDRSPLNPKYRHFIAAWRRLPLPVAGTVGPWLARHLG